MEQGLPKIFLFICTSSNRKSDKRTTKRHGMLFSYFSCY